MIKISDTVYIPESAIISIELFKESINSTFPSRIVLYLSRDKSYDLEYENEEQLMKAFNNLKSILGNNLVYDFTNNDLNINVITRNCTPVTDSLNVNTLDLEWGSHRNSNI